MTLVSPVHADGELVGYVANLAHHVDVGGGAPASIGAFREVFQEGVIIPPVKLVESGAIVEDVFALLLAQIRSKHETAGDLRAQVAANATGVRRVQALVARHGPDVVTGVMDELLPTPSGARAQSSRRCRAASSRRRDRSTPTATPTSRFGSGRGSRSARTASGSTWRAATRSAARLSTRPSRRRSPPARTRSSASSTLTCP